MGSCGIGAPISAVADHGIEHDQELAHAGDHDDLEFLADQAFGERGNHGLWYLADSVAMYSTLRTAARPPLM